MTSINRRSLVVRSAAVAGGLALGRATLAGAAPSSRYSAPLIKAQDKTEILIHHIWGTPPGGEPAEKPSPMTQVIDAFNEESDSVVATPFTPGGYYETMQKTQADMAAGNPPDIVSIPWAFLEYAVDGLGANRIPDIAGESFDNLKGLLSDTAWELVTKDGGIYGLPWGLSTPIFYYNADIFEEAGIDPNVAFNTWDEFGEEALKLQEFLNGNPVFSLMYNKDWPAQTLIQSNGGRVMNDDGTFGFTSDEAKEAMQTIADLDTQGLYDRGAKPELRQSFIAGSTAIMQGSISSLKGVYDEAQFNVKTSTWPKFGDKPVIASTGGSFLANFTQDESKYEAVLEFLNFCAGPVGYPIWSQTGYVNISNLDLDQLEGQEPAYAQFDAGLIRETNWPGARGVEAGSTWDVYCERIWANDISVEDGVQQAYEEIKDIVGEG